MRRRFFLRKSALYAASVAGALTGAAFVYQFFNRSSAAGRRIRIGRPADFPLDTYTLVSKYNIYVYRDHEAIRAVSAVCTHLGCTVRRTTEGFVCPCHGSRYSDLGKVLSGPAPSSLCWYRLEKTPDGIIMADLDITISPADKLYIL